MSSSFFPVNSGPFSFCASLVCGLSFGKNNSDLFEGGDKFFYHVHSYRPESAPADWLICETEYGGWFPSGVRKGRVAGFQFHPEKSQDTGISLLGNVLKKINAS